MLTRPRRNRKSSIIRSLVQENDLNSNSLVQPLFLIEKNKKKEPISAIPNIYRYPIHEILKEIESCLQLGISSYIIFPVIPEEYKNKEASYAYMENNFYIKAIQKIKEVFKEDVCLITDVALDPYNIDGHDGLLMGDQILNDETLPILGKMSLLHAQAGADIIVPSDMMDGRVKFIRNILDENQYHHTNILSYTAKYASCFYSPFRTALNSTPQKGNKKTYQMNYANSKEAIKEAFLDEQEGADILMVKPALFYLDIIQLIKKHSNLPVAAYHVSGEYSMLKSAVEKGWLDNKKAIQESLMCIRRAGADIIISYAAKEWAEMMK